MQMVRIRVNVGTRVVKTSGQLVRLIAELSGMEVADLGTAQVFADYSWIEVRHDLANDIIEAIDHERIDDHVLVATR